MKYTHALYTCTLVTAIWIGCADETPLQTAAQSCSLSSECTTPLVCAFGKCHQACRASRDCAKGERCVQGEKPSYVCQKQGCSRNSECVGTQVCAVDAQCRDQCLTQKDCLADQVCSAGVCADREDLVNGTLPGIASDGGTGSRCTLPTDCPGDLVCLRGGICGPECIIDKDCPRTYACRPVTTGGPGRCFPPTDAGVTPSDAGEPSAPVAAVAAGGFHACALLVSGRVKCWGYNDNGSLGLGDRLNRGDAPGEMGDALPYVDLGTARTAKTLEAGSEHTCAILDNDRVKCWGYNAFGQLGLGDATNRGDGPGEMGDALPYVDLGTGRTAKALAAADGYTCAVLDNDRVKCWGYNFSGELGLGDLQHRGDGPGEMGDALPYIDLGTGRTVKSLTAVYHAACAVLDNNLVKCWGFNGSGELGLGDNLRRGGAPGEMGDTLPYVDLGTGRTAKFVHAGVTYTCAVLDNERLKCWGYNANGELGLGDTVVRGDGPGEMGDALPYVDLGSGRLAKSLSSGIRSACALLDNQRIKCWGINATGQLGLGDVQARGDAPGEMGDALPYVDVGAGRLGIAVAAGSFFSCALLDNQRIKCWGQGVYGQLGVGDQISRGDAPGEMGDALPNVQLVGVAP